MDRARSTDRERSKLNSTDEKARQICRAFLLRGKPNSGVKIGFDATC
jgi:hypothetical protein